MNAPFNLAVRCCLSLAVLALCCAPAIAGDSANAYSPLDAELNNLVAVLMTMGKVLAVVAFIVGLVVGVVGCDLRPVMAAVGVVLALGVMPSAMMAIIGPMPPTAAVERSTPCPTGQYRDGSSCRQQEVVAACPAGWLLSEHDGSCTRAVDAVTAAPAEPEASPGDHVARGTPDSQDSEKRPIVLPVLALLMMAGWFGVSANYHARRPTLFGT